MPGWGLGSWGTSPWGTGGVGTFYVVSALVTSERTLVVELSAAPRAQSTIGAGDALNPRTWHVTRQDTGEELRVLAVRSYSLTTFFELYLLDKFANSLVTHQVEAPTMVDASGALIGSPDFIDFLGCVASVAPPAERNFVDLANAQIGREEFAGTLSVGSDGDYANESGVSLYRKLIIRRLTTTPGDFFHFDPTYGMGLRIKEPFTLSDMPKLKAEIERQLLQEPDFATVRAAVTLGRDGVMAITVAVKVVRTGEQLAIPILVPTSLVAF